MRKFFLTALIGGFTLTASAQVTVDDFENGSNSWNTVSCGAGIVDNPYQTGLNLSCKVLQLTRAMGCENWSGAIYTLPSQQTGYNYVHALMYRNNTGMPNVKVTDSGSNLDVAPMTTIEANEWQDVVFDISGKAVDFVMFMADRNDISEDAIVYIDDVILSNDAAPRTIANSACGAGGEGNDDETTLGDYTLVFNEDFTDGALDRNVWNVEVNGDGGGNNEQQYYCEKGVSIEQYEGKQCLTLTATKEEYMGKHCTSGRVNTKGNLYYTYGRIDARIKMPKTANGLWPAFWQMGNNFDQVGWPRCGETDIVEMGNSNGFNGSQERYFNGAMHVGSAWDAVWSEDNALVYPYSLQDTFHIFTLIWTPTSIDMYVDYEATHAAAYFHQDLEPNDNPDYNRQVVFGKPNFVIFNLAVGGQFPGIYDVNKITALNNGPAKMYIDWVRIYQRGDANQSFVCPSASDAIEQVNPSEEGSALEEIEQLNHNAKILRHGKLFIEHDGAYYDVLGNRVTDIMR